MDRSPLPLPLRFRRVAAGSTTIAAALLALTLLSAAPGAAQGAGRLPDAAGVAPPSWVQPGVRLSYYAAGASVGGSSDQLIEDPAGPWQDPVTGKHYRNTADTGESLGGASGDGVSQVTVIALDGTDVVLQMDLYGIDRATNTLSVLPGTGAKVPGGAVEGLWLAPQLLDRLQTGQMGGLVVLRGDYPLGGTTYHAVSIVNPAPGAYSSVTYDTATGLLLASTTSTAGPRAPVRLPGQDAAQGASELTISRFAGMRQLTTPGLGRPAPAWVARRPTLSYSGQYAWTNPVDPTSGSAVYPMEVQATFIDTGPTWATYRLQSRVSMPGSAGPSVSSGVSSGIGAYWWDPDALAAMTPGQVLDQDPVTGLTVTVAGLVQGPVGPAVVIASSIPGTNGQSTFDLATGVLVSQAFDVQASGVRAQLGLQAMP